jgi:hypothetical protein
LNQAAGRLRSDEQLGSPVQGDVKQKILLPELEAKIVFAASNPPQPFVFFFLAA